MPPLSNLMPVKVRGKRRGCSAEKWHTGKRRRAELQCRPKIEGLISVASQDSSRSSKRRRQQPDSPIEALPAEILQQIFAHAANIELPTVSRQLALKLSKSQHLHNELTTRLLEPILGIKHGVAPLPDRAAATRLLNSRFMTYDFFVSWLQSRSTAAVSGNSGDRSDHQLWSALQPSQQLLPPRKLMSPPFSQQKADFLAIFAGDISDLSAIDAGYEEFAQEGLVAAVGKGEGRFVSLLLSMGLKSSTELLRVAVVDAGCRKDIVQMLVKGPLSPQSDGLRGPLQLRAEVDLLDPVLWSWAQKEGNERGQWLTAFLREEQRLKEHLTTLDTYLP